MANFEPHIYLEVEEGCVVRFREEVPAQLVKFLESQKAETWSIISAYNPYSQELSTDENQRRHGLLQQLLTELQSKFDPAVGRSIAGPWEEPSFLVLDLSYDMAQSLGTVFEQDAVVFGERGAVVEMIFCD